ncbi:MAG: hypothetical protein ACJAVK_001815 [Akkermansiaceae bacterium]|jgi:hypothetical protein
MDHTRDNPLKRFTAFWIAILLVFCFGVGLIILRPLTHANSETAYDMRRDDKLAVKADIDRAQEGALNKAALQKAFDEQKESFTTNTVAAGSMAVPGAAPAPVPVDTPADTPAE